MSYRRVNETLLYQPSQEPSTTDKRNPVSCHGAVHPLVKSSSIYHSVTSQDSFDTFHDAVSTLQRDQKENSSLNGTPTLGYKSRLRTRHASSGPRIDCERGNNNNLTNMLQKVSNINEVCDKSTIKESDENIVGQPSCTSPDIPTSSRSESQSSKSTIATNSEESSALVTESLRHCDHADSNGIEEYPNIRKKMEAELAYMKPRSKKTALQQIKNEFTLSNFKFNHKRPHLFVTSQWQQPNQMCCMYLAYRLFWGVYFSMWSVWSLVGFAGYDSAPSLKFYYLLYLTDWAIWLLAIDTMMQAVNVSLHIRKIARDGNARYERMKTSFKVSWIMSNVTSSIHVFITFMFWTLIYSKEEYPITAIILNTRVMPCIYVVLDCIISGTPRRILHAYLPMMLLTVYGIATDIYYLVGGKSSEGEVALYPILDWSQPLQTLMFGSCLILLLIPLIHVSVVCLLSGMRGRLHRTLSHSQYEVADVENSSTDMEMNV